MDLAQNHTDGFTKDNPKDQLELDKVKREEVNVPSMCKGPEVGHTMDPCGISCTRV